MFVIYINIYHIITRYVNRPFDEEDVIFIRDYFIEVCVQKFALVFDSI